MKITEKEYNVITGLETITEREETEAETQFRLDLEKTRTSREAEAEAKAAQKAAVFTKLGLTADEIAALLS
jgi:hypothetical protein